METPVCFTSLGRRPCAALTRFCTSTAAMSMSRSTSNVTLMLLEPSLLLDDWMYFIPGTPLMASSRGVVTADSTTSELAPV